MDDWMDAESHVERAHEHFQAERWAEAESELRRALALRPHEPEWLFNLGLTLDAAGRWKEASEAFATAHGLAPDETMAAVMAARCLMRGEDYRGAATWCQTALKADASSMDAYVCLIECHAKLGEHEQAELTFYMSQQTDPRHAEALVAMADSLLDQSKFERAIWCLKEAQEIDGDLPGVQARLAEAYAATGRSDRARQLYLRELRSNPGDIDTLLDLGALLLEMNRLDESREKFSRVLELEPENVEAHFEIGRVAERRGDTREAIREFDLVHRLDPEFPGVRRRLAALLMCRDPRSEAGDLLKRDLARFRADAEAFDAADVEELGNLLLDAGLAADAAEVFARLAAVRGDAASHHLRSVALLEAGELDAGREAARTALSLDGTLVAAMHNLAIASLREGRWHRAARWLRKARAIAPEDASLRRLRWAVYWHAAATVVAGLVRRVRR